MQVKTLVDRRNLRSIGCTSARQQAACHRGSGGISPRPLPAWFIPSTAEFVLASIPQPGDSCLSLGRRIFDVLSSVTRDAWYLGHLTTRSTAPVRPNSLAIFVFPARFSLTCVEVDTSKWALRTGGTSGGPARAAPGGINDLRVPYAAGA